ncbi:ABC transporter ATP-binding protein [Luteimicrobium subarcticum]|uniref:Iron complex transport system ATP-binding protein n=1 Tax=Luteimicrobium subarcticum TaxID=620910 RepID=A0A2M8WQV3_9MICO|nr:ABC transporter ATP-binding protein [Luteimicrobium subarcticum]PJI93297.1 iron complex transport system ATP-binding protein [Luteimicrobium subarcticum]
MDDTPQTDRKDPVDTTASEPTGAGARQGAAVARHTLEARDLTLAYDGRVVVDGLGIAVEPGAVTSIVGPNACGKSTLLRGLSRLLAPQSGAVLLDGQDVATLGTRRVATVLGLLPQTPTAPDGITVADLVGRGRYPHQGWLRRWTTEDDEAVAEAMEATSVAELATRPLAELSGGQRQRVWIAMALAQRTDLLLLDEPTTFLDVAHQIEVLELLSDLNRDRGTTIVMVLHDLNLAVRYSDRLVAMRDGRVVAAGEPDAVVTAELVEEVFGIGALVTTDPVTGDRMVVPHGRSRRAR